MDIYAMPGDEILFSGAENCAAFVREQGLKHLKIGQVYTVAGTEIYSDYTHVYVTEVPDIGFNSILFDDVTKLQPPDCSWDEIEALLMPLTHQAIIDQEIIPGIPLKGELESIRRCYYEFTSMYRAYYNRYRDPELAKKRALNFLRKRYQL